MNNLKIVSLNTRGIADHVKRRKVFRFLKNARLQVCLLQECHSTDKTNFMWSNEWGNKCIFSNGNSNAKGVAILLSGKLSTAVREIVRDIQGRYVMCKLEIDGYDYCMCNVYGPNKDQPEFFDELKSEIEKLNCVHVIIGGDFNVALNVKLDRNEEKQYNKMNKEKVIELMEDLDLCDIWRTRNINRQAFTWCKRSPKLSWSRIDYFLLSQNLVNRCSSSDISGCIFSDHSMIDVIIENEEGKRGPSMWKLNDMLLENEEFCNNMIRVIENAKKRFGQLNGFDKWEMIKQEITKFARDFAKCKSKEEKVKLFELYKLLGIMQDEIVKTGYCDQQLDNSMRKVVQEIESYAELDCKRAAFRCKLDWREKGELGTKYFFQLEKRNYTS